MFVHLVLIKLKAGVTRADPRVPAWEALFKALPAHCTGIVSVTSGWNFTDRPVAYDYGINMVFATKADLVAYGPNPKHQDVVVALREIAEWVICDFETGQA